MRLQPKSEGPLAGIVVVDLTRVLAGPYCTMILGDLGARVIKVEMPPRGDDTRSTGPFIGDDPETQVSGYFFSVNRNKESIALDLKNPEDAAVFDALIAQADVLVENFTPGTLARLGYGWPVLHARHPELILASISGFGQNGPYSALPAYDMVVQAMGGIMSLTGEAGGPPTRVGVSIGDLAAGMFGALGVQAAIIERMRTGSGKHVDIAMLDAQVALLENAIARTQIDGVAPGPIGSRHPSITPFATFHAKDRPMVIAAGNDAMFRRLCIAISCPDLAEDPRYATNPERCRNHAELAADIERAIASRTAEEWILILRNAGVACGPLNTVSDLLSDPQVVARGMIANLPVEGTDRQIGVPASPIRFAGEAPSSLAPAPHLNQHGDALRRELNLSASGQKA